MIPALCSRDGCDNMFIPSRLGQKCCSNKCSIQLLWANPQYRQHMIDAHRGKIHSGSFKSGHKHRNTGKTRFKKGQTGIWKIREMTASHKEKLLATNHAKKGKPSFNTRGEKNWNWKGGTSRTERQKISQSIEYKNWRSSVFERDNYTCQQCNKRGGKLQADHIKPFSLFPELIFDINNGRTLCVNCHYKTDSYGGKMYKQYGRKTA